MVSIVLDLDFECLPVVKEVKFFYDKNIRSKAILTGIGYKELYLYFDSKITLDEAIEYNSKHMIRKTISNEINEKGLYKGYSLFQFGDKCYSNLDEKYDRIEKLCDEDGKK